MRSLLNDLFIYGLLVCLVSAISLSHGFAESANRLELKDAPDGALANDTRWYHPRFLSFRPGDGQIPQVNPPRFSWGYVPTVQTPARNRIIPADSFRFQISKSKTFRKPVVDVVCDYNYFNALKPLSNGTWYWRVYYTNHKIWSDVRSFTVTSKATKWDRSVILELEDRLKRQRRPRLAPPTKTWKQWAEQLKNDPRSSYALSRLFVWADRAIAKDWYKNGLPASDKATGNEKNRTELLRFYRMGEDLAMVAFAYRLSEDPKYARVKEHFMRLASYPIGGLSAPEGHGSNIKFTSIITSQLALFYDWFYHELKPEERKILRDSIHWRLEAQTFSFPNWAADSGTKMNLMGVSIENGSHPFQNFMWNILPTMLMFGEDPRITSVAENKLSFLAGVSGGAGADEAWNEGQHYGLEKPATMLDAMLWAQMIAPDLLLGKNPFLNGYGQWMNHLMPTGIQRMPFGDTGSGDVSRFDFQIGHGAASNSYRLALLTGDGRYTWRHEQGKEYVRSGFKEREGVKNIRGYTPLMRRPWELFYSLARLELPKPVVDERKQKLFHESGWVMVNSEKPSDWQSYEKAVGMLFQARSRGGFSHSFKSDGSFVWHAYGEVLTAGGGTMLKMNPHTSETIAHNSMLIDGVGQNYHFWTMEEPYIARIIGFHQGKGYTHWVADLTNAYHEDAGLKRWLRHVVFIDERWFVIYDDLESSDEARHFSWRYEVFPDVPLDLDEKEGRFSYEVNGVQANVVFATPAKLLGFHNMQGEDAFKNPFTDKNWFDEIAKRFAIRSKNANWSFMDQSTAAIRKWIPKHNLWVTNRKPSKKWNLMSALVASPQGQARADFTVIHDHAIQVKPVGGKTKTVSFGSKRKADIVIDPTEWRKFADKTR